MSFDISRLSQQIDAITQSCTPETAPREDFLGMVGQYLRPARRVPPHVDLAATVVYSQVLRMTLEFALLPRAARLPVAVSVCLTCKITPWKSAAP